MVRSPRFDEHELRQMTDGYERYFTRGERYALLVVAPRNAVPVGPKERKLIADWANQPRVRTLARRLCVGAAIVVRDPVTRGTLTAILWLWTPPVPLRTSPNLEDGIDHCLGRLAEERIPLGRPASMMRLRLCDLLHDA